MFLQILTKTNFKELENFSGSFSFREVFKMTALVLILILIPLLCLIGGDENEK